MIEPRLEKYKVLGAAIEFAEFTVRDLAGYTGVESDYIHKLVSERDIAAYFESLGPAPTSGRGRPPHRYRIAPDHLAEVQAIVDELKRTLSPPAPPKANEEPSRELLAVEHVLLDEFFTAKTPEEQDALLRCATQSLEQDQSQTCPIPAPAGRDAANFDSLPPPTETRRWIASTLLELAEWVFTITHGSPREGQKFLEFSEVIKRVVTLGQAARDMDGEYAADILKWLSVGPLGRLRLGPFLGLTPSQSLSLPVVPNRNECWPQSQVCPFLAAVPRTTTSETVPVVPVAGSRVDLIRAGDDIKSRSVFERVTDALRAVAPRVLVRGHGFGDREVSVSPDVQVALVACNSGESWEQVLALTERWGQIACSLFVLDATATKDFKVEVQRRKAQYVAYAETLDESSLFLEVPALAQLLHQTRLGGGE